MSPSQTIRLAHHGLILLVLTSVVLPSGCLFDSSSQEQELEEVDRLRLELESNLWLVL